MASGGWVASASDSVKNDILLETCWMLKKMDLKEFDFDISLGIHDLETMANESLAC